MERFQARSISKFTKLSSDTKLYIAISNEAEKHAEYILNIIGEQAQAKILTNPSDDIIRNADGHVITIGNLSNNRCVAMLYHKHILFTDKTYPGNEGYELRTILDPFATGFNVLHIGYSDIAGLTNAIHAFVKKIKADGIEFLCDIHATSFHYDELQAKYIMEQKCDPNDPTAYYTSPIDQKGFVAYFTGDKKAIAEYNDAWQIILKQDNNEDLHLKLKTRASAWRLMELTGMLDDTLREDSVNLFYRWIESKEGIARINIDAWLVDDYPRQNHGLLTAFGIIYIADYFIKYYPSIKRPYEWKEMAERVFSVYQSGAWKPICDGLCHGWSMSQPVLFEHAFYNDDHKFLEQNGAKKAAECIIAVTNNTGWFPESGDSQLSKAFQATALASAAYYYQDGRYNYVRNMCPKWRHGNIDWTSYLSRSFDVGIKPIEPTDHIGIKVIEMDPLIYHAWEVLPERAASIGGVSARPPEVPLDQCFDKLTYRNGFQSQDEYLLIDGLGGGSHSYDDAMSILDYQKFGLDFIVACDDLTANETENHSMLTIYRNGECEKIPSFAAIEKTEKLDNGHYYVSMILKNCSGTDWRRELYIIPDVCIVVNDTVTANQNGNYHITSRYRTPGRAKLINHQLESTRINKEKEKIKFKISSKASHTCNYEIFEKKIGNPRIKTEENPDKNRFYELRLEHYFNEKYNLPNDEFCLTSFEQNISADLKENQNIIFTNILYSSKSDDEISLQANQQHIVVRINDKEFETNLKAYPYFKQDTKKLKNPLTQDKYKTLASFDAPISSFSSFKEVLDEVLICGLENGSVYKIHKNNTDEIFNVKLKVNDIIVHNNFIYISFGDHYIAKYDFHGILHWQHDIQRVPTVYSWWELPVPKALTLKITHYKGSEVLVAGCGDDSIKYFDFDGNLLNSYYYYIAVPDMLESIDVNGDGIEELVAGGKILACRSNVQIIDQNLSKLFEFANEQWTSHVTALKTLHINNIPSVMVGVNHRNNLRVFSFDQGVEIERLSKPVLGAVTDIILIDSKNYVVAGTSEKLVLCYDLYGNQKWLHTVDSEIINIIYEQSSIYVFTNKGDIYLYSESGDLLDNYYFNQNIQKVIKNEKTYIVTKNQIHELQLH